MINSKKRGVNVLVDSNLPVDRDRLKNRLTRLVREDDEILGCFFGGSIGSKTEDFYSDIDARLVIKSGVDQRRKQQEVIRAIGEYLFIECFDKNKSVIHYATFIKLELFVYTEDTLEPSIWLKQIEIVKDNGLIEEMSELSLGLEYVVTQKTFDNILNEYYAAYFELYRCLKRNEKNHMYVIILDIKQHLVSMWYLSKGFIPNENGSWDKYEGRKTKLSHLESEFILSYTPCTVEELGIFTKKIEILMFESVEKVATYHNLEFSVDVFKKVHGRISFEKESD